MSYQVETAQVNNSNLSQVYANPVEGVNAYLHTLLDPCFVTGIPIPDLNLTASVPKSIEISTTLSIDGNANGETPEILFVNTPHSVRGLGKIFIRFPQQAVNTFAYWRDIMSDQDISLNYKRSRTVSSCLMVKAGSISPTFTVIQGTMNGTQVQELPSFTPIAPTLITFDNFIAYKRNPRDQVLGVSVAKGVVALAHPDGSDMSFKLLDTNAVTNTENLVLFRFSQTTPVVVVPTTTNFDFPFELWGSVKIVLRVQQPGSAASFAYSASLALQTYIYNEITQTASYTDLVVANCSSVTAANVNYIGGVETSAMYIPSSYPTIPITGAVACRVQLRVTLNGAAANTTIEVHGLEHYNKGLCSPASMIGVKNLPSNTELIYSGRTNYEVVPSTELAKELSATTDRKLDPSDLLQVSAFAALGIPDPKIKFMYSLDEYIKLNESGYFSSFVKKSNLSHYAASMPTILKTIGSALVPALGSAIGIPPTITSSLFNMLSDNAEGVYRQTDRATGRFARREVNYAAGEYVFVPDGFLAFALLNFPEYNISSTEEIELAKQGLVLLQAQLKKVKTIKPLNFSFYPFSSHKYDQWLSVESIMTSSDNPLNHTITITQNGVNGPPLFKQDYARCAILQLEELSEIGFELISRSREKTIYNIQNDYIKTNIRVFLSTVDFDLRKDGIHIFGNFAHGLYYDVRSHDDENGPPGELVQNQRKKYVDGENIPKNALETKIDDEFLREFDQYYTTTPDGDYCDRVDFQFLCPPIPFREQMVLLEEVEPRLRKRFIKKYMCNDCYHHISLNYEPDEREIGMWVIDQIKQCPKHFNYNAFDIEPYIVTMTLEDYLDLGDQNYAAGNIKVNNYDIMITDTLVSSAKDDFDLKYLYINSHTRNVAARSEAWLRGCLPDFGFGVARFPVLDADNNYKKAVSVSVTAKPIWEGIATSYTKIVVKAPIQAEFYLSTRSGQETNFLLSVAAAYLCSGLPDDYYITVFDKVPIIGSSAGLAIYSACMFLPLGPLISGTITEVGLIKPVLGVDQKIAGAKGSGFPIIVPKTTENQDLCTPMSDMLAGSFSSRWYVNDAQQVIKNPDHITEDPSVFCSNTAATFILTTIQVCNMMLAAKPEEQAAVKQGRVEYISEGAMSGQQTKKNAGKWIIDGISKDYSEWRAEYPKLPLKEPTGPQKNVWLEFIMKDRAKKLKEGLMEKGVITKSTTVLPMTFINQNLPLFKYVVQHPNMFPQMRSDAQYFLDQFNYWLGGKSMVEFNSLEGDEGAAAKRRLIEANTSLGERVNAFRANQLVPNSEYNRFKAAYKYENMMWEQRPNVNYTIYDKPMATNKELKSNANINRKPSKFAVKFAQRRGAQFGDGEVKTNFKPYIPKKLVEAAIVNPDVGYLEEEDKFVSMLHGLALERGYGGTEDLINVPEVTELVTDFLNNPTNDQLDAIAENLPPNDYPQY